MTVVTDVPSSVGFLNGVLHMVAMCMSGKRDLAKFLSRAGSPSAKAFIVNSGGWSARSGGPP